MFEQNIYLYWDSEDIPQEILNNVHLMQKFNPEFNVQICGDFKINSYKHKYPDLLKLYNKISIAAIKSDIARCILLYENGGVWLDCHCVINKNTMNIIYNVYKDYDFCMTRFRNNLKTSCLVAKKECNLLKKVLIDLENRLQRHYNKEIKQEEYIPYNAFKITGVPVFSDRLNLDGFDYYKSGIMDLSGLVKFYACNRNHHHGENIHKHWSRLQKTQKLFLN
jgi:mannosyltransferase OCH1-like enzyme